MRIFARVLAALSVLAWNAADASAYTVGPPSPWMIEGGEQVAKEAVERRQHEEAETAARKAAEEHAAAEAREREEREHATAEAKLTQERTEQEARERKLPSSLCRVPRLKGHSLSAARRLLANAHCSLGRVHTERGSRVGQVVVSQGTPAGAKRASGAAVALILGRRT